MANIGDRIKEARERRGLSQAALANLCGWLSQTRVYNYEKNKRKLNVDELQTLSLALKTPIEFFLGLDCNTEAELTRKVPLIKWDDLKLKDVLQSESNDFVVIPSGIELSVNAFALKIVGSSMQTDHGISLFDGSIAFIDMEKTPLNNDYVLVNHKGNYLVRQLEITENICHLKPLNKQFQVISLDSYPFVLGVVVAMQATF